MGKWLSGIFENIQGNVGSKAIVRDKTKKGRSRIFFDLAVGVPDEKRGVFSTWRHCIVYGDGADNLKNIVKGSYVEVSGFVQTVAMRDKTGEFLVLDGIVQKEEHLISEKARHVPGSEYCAGRQLPLVGETLAPVGQA
jgi:hypothetical protein